MKFVFILGAVLCVLVESQFPNQELHLGRGSECLES